MGDSASPYVAVMDIQELDDEVFVWHVPHLLGGIGYHVYLAYGRIRGRGYYAVSLRELERNGLQSIFPEMTQLGGHSMFGHELRLVMFHERDYLIHQYELHVIRSISLLFRNLEFPMATALVSLRPRSWRRWRRAHIEGRLHSGASDEVRSLATELRITNIPERLQQESWLEIGNVDTQDFRDVQQWIDLISMIAQAIGADSRDDVEADPEQPRLDGRRRKRDDLDEQVSKMPERSDEEGEEEKDDNASHNAGDGETLVEGSTRKLRERKVVSYKSCRDSLCGRCVTCHARQRQ